jgi:cell division transport system permease protein
MAFNLFFWLSEGARGFLYHRLTATITVAGITLTLWFFGFLYLIYFNVENFRHKLLTNLQFEIFLEVVSDSSQHPVIGELIAKFDGITKVIYVSRSQAAQIFAKEFGEDIFTVLEENPLPASFKVTLSPDKMNPRNIDYLTAEFRKLPKVEEVVFQGGLLSLIETKFRAFARTLTIIGSVMFIGTSAIFFYGMKLSITSRKALIDSLSLYGAKMSSLKLPFIFEGMLAGTLSGILAFAGLWIVWFFIDRFLVPFENNNFLFLLILAGSFFGFIGGVISVMKNLKGL